MQNGSNIRELDPAQAYWNQRFLLKKCHDRVLSLCKEVNRQTDLFPFQWAQLMAFAMEFQPDIIVELGRGKGNSTCAFTEVANQLKHKDCRVISICLTDDWETEILPRISRIVPASWFEPLQTLQTDICTFNYEKALNNFKKIIIFWDAHGFDVAECVLGKILPLIAERKHVVIMHDLTDARYLQEQSYQYGNNTLWKGNNWDGPRLRIGNIESTVEQAVAILDFSTRNKLSLHSADHSFHTRIGSNPQRVKELKEIIGDDLFSLTGHWFWFSLNEIPGPYTFPNIVQTVSREPVLKCSRVPLLTRLIVAIKILFNRYPVEKIL